MANMLQMMKQFRDVRKLQKELESRTFEERARMGAVVAVVRGDMSVKSLRIEPKAWDPARPERLAQVSPAPSTARWTRPRNRWPAT